MSQIIKPNTPYQPAVFSKFLGIASTGENYKKPREFAASLKNAELTKENKVISARGYRTLGTWNDNRIREILQYRKSGLDIFLVFGSNSAGTTGGIATVSSQWTTGITFTPSLTLSDFDTECVLLQFSDLAYLYNGTDDAFFNGSAWATIGAAAPTGQASLASTVAGSMNTSSDYYVGYCWYDSVNKRRTNMSVVSAVMTTGATSANGGLRVSFPVETAPTGYDKKEVYCTLAFRNQFFVDQQISASATTCDITQSDAARAANFVYEGGDNQPSQTGDLAVVANGKFYLGKSTDKTCRVIRSKNSDQYGSMPQSYNPRHFTDCDPNASDMLTGLGVCGNQENQTVIVGKQKSFGKIVRLSPDVEIYQKIADIGVHGQKSFFTIGELCGFVGESNIYLTDGNQYWEVGGGEDGQGIAETMRNLSQQFKGRVNSCAVERSKQIRISVVRAGKAWPDFVLFGHYQHWKQYQLVMWTTREPGPVPATHPGMQCSCSKVVLDDQDQPRTIFGNSNANGKLYEGDYGTSDDTLSMWKEWEFRPENFGDPQNEKVFSDIYAKMRTGDTSTTISFGIKKNLQGAMKSLGSKTIGGTGLTFGTGQLGITPFSQAPIGNLTVPCQERANEASIVIRETTTKTIELLDLIMNAVT